MKIRDIIISEAPLQDYVPLGDFNKPGPFRGVDKKLVPHPTNQIKTAKFLENTPYDFRLFFSNISGTAGWGRSEQGAVEHKDVVEVFGDEIAAQIINGSENAITVVFLGNSGDQKVMMTPWIMAHRLGHAVNASTRPQSVFSGNFTSWSEMDQHWERTVRSFLTDYYGNQDRGGLMQQTLVALFNAIGTQRSSRERSIARPYEFVYELFAQYLKTGDVTLNPLPRRLGFGHQAWGKPTRYLTARPEFSDQDLANATSAFSNDMRIMFSSVLSECEGNIFFM